MVGAELTSKGMLKKSEWWRKPRSGVWMSGSHRCLSVYDRRLSLLREMRGSGQKGKNCSKKATGNRESRVTVVIDRAQARGEDLGPNEEGEQGKVNARLYQRSGTQV